MRSEPTVDPAIVEVVDQVANRFGVDGLDDLMALASTRRDVAERALAQLAELGRPEPSLPEQTGPHV